MCPQTNWEETLRAWSKPVDEQQEAKANYTAEQVRQALSTYELVPNSMMKVAAQGSKLNNTDTSDESDVDIRVEFHLDKTQPDDIPTVFLERRTAIAKSLVEVDDLRSYTLPLTQHTFKDHITTALEEQFGDASVNRHDKCIKVDESHLLFPADVVPCFPVRLYSAYGDYEPGVSITTDLGKEILNYPEQHYASGALKNLNTSKKFKRMVRCLKRMENYLLEAGSVTDPLPSFFMECLVYNCPDPLFGPDSYAETFVNLMWYLYNVLGDTAMYDAMVEVNQVKSLFNDGQSWTPGEGRELVLQAWYKVSR